MSQRRKSKIAGQKHVMLMVKLRLSDAARRDYACTTQDWLPREAYLKLPTRTLDAETCRAFARLPHQKRSPHVIPLMLPTCRGTRCWCASRVPVSGADWKRLLAAYQLDYQQEVVSVQLQRDKELALVHDDCCTRLTQPITTCESLYR